MRTDIINFSKFKTRTVSEIIQIILVLNLALINCTHIFNNINLPFKKTYRNHLRQQRLLLISFGGFRHDFIKNYNLNNFAQFQNEGAYAPYLNPQFSTQSMPNHWSIATGTYVETHGIIANKFYDPLYKEYFFSNKNDLKWWNETEPIWLTAVKQGIRTGVYFWPGSEAVSYDSDLYNKVSYNENTPLSFKINQSIKWFINEDYKFVAVYHNQPDAIAHKYGINSPEFNVTLRQLDDTFGQLIEQLKENGLYHANDFNIIVVSDHGMSNIRKNIFINEYIDESDAVIWSFSRNLIHLKPLIDMDLLLLKLSKIPDITVTLKEDMPERLHYKNHRRIADVIISAIEGVGFIYIGKEPLQFNGRTASLSYELKKKLLIAAADKASHGYDNIYPNMKGIFLTRGSMLKKNYSSEIPIDNVDIYPLMCNILAIECENRNGSFEKSKQFLKYEHRLISHSNRQIVENSNSYNNLKSLFNFKNQFLILILFLNIFLK